MELWGKVNGLWFLLLATNPEILNNQKWYMITSKVSHI